MIRTIAPHVFALFYLITLGGEAALRLARQANLTAWTLDEATFVAAPGLVLSGFAGVATLALVINLVRPYPWARNRAVLAAAFLLTLALSLRVTDASWRELFDPDGLGGAVRLWSGLTHPNLSLLAKATAQALETVLIAFAATTLAVPIALALAFFAAKNLARTPFRRAIYVGVRLILNIARSIEPLIWALIFTVWVGIGPFAGMLALFAHAASSLAKYYSEIIEEVNEGPLDGIRATGASEFQVAWCAILPQVTLPFIGMTMYRWDTNVRMATVIGLVGGGGIGTMLIQYQGQAMWPEVGCIILVIAVIVWAMDAASAYVREALK